MSKKVTVTRTGRAAGQGVWARATIEVIYSGYPDLRAPGIRAFGTYERSNRHVPPVLEAIYLPLLIRAMCS